MQSDDPDMDNKNQDVAVKVESSVNIENKDIEQGKQATEPPVKKHVKEEKIRKKDDKSVEQVLKALNSLETTEEKLAAMCKKYSDIVDENRKLQLAAKQSEKRLSLVQREKEQLQTEHSKAVLTRSRLESLCRELQRQNKAIKDESFVKIREEEEKRKEVSAKFQSTLNEITALMQQNNEKNSKLREDNLEMTKKFKTVCEQYELREQQVEKISKQMQLEAQLADAKLSKVKMERVAEKELLLKEKQQLLMELTKYQAKCQELEMTEVNLRSQISLYTDKYDEFQTALSRSNEVFGGFKGEMEKMSKKICKLEKETSSWKQRWEKSHQALLEMAADKQQRDSELALATRQLTQLQKLCRTLQAERTSLLGQLRAEEAASKIKDASSNREVPLEPTQKPHNTEAETSLCSHELCRHEPEKEILVSQNEIDEAKNTDSEEIKNLSQNTQPSPAESTLTELIHRVNLENSPATEPELIPVMPEPIALESINNSITISPVVTIADEQNPVSTQDMQNAESQISQELINLESAVISLLDSPNVSETNDSQVSEITKESLEIQSVLEEKEKSVTENKVILGEMKELAENSTTLVKTFNELEINSVTTLPLNDESSDVKLNCQEQISDSVINGQTEEFIAEPKILTCDHEVDGSPVNKMTVEPINTPNDANHSVGNEIMEQIPVNSVQKAAEFKKGKDGAKKRKNK